MKLVFATHNANKVKEIRKLLPSSFEVLSLIDLNEEDIPETGSTLEENSEIKAQYVYQKHQVACFSDDSGLEVAALDNAPGVYSARYAGTGSSEDNMDLLLKNLAGKEDRKAKFKTIITYIDTSGNQIQFAGEAPGIITKDKSGAEGFGYDPIFKPEGYNITFAEMPLEEKNRISHRGKALKKLIEHLTK